MSPQMFNDSLQQKHTPDKILETQIPKHFKNAAVKQLFPPELTTMKNEASGKY